LDIIDKAYNKLNNFFYKKKIFYTLEKFIKKNLVNKIFNAKKIVLIWNFGGYEQIFVKDLIIGLALKLRGYKPHHIICDGTPIACIQRTIEDYVDIHSWKKKCIKCAYKMESCAKLYKGNYSFSSEYISKNDIIKIQNLSAKIDIKEIYYYKYDQVEVGKIAFSSLNRFMKGLFMDLNKLDKKFFTVYRHFFYASIVNLIIAKNVHKMLRPKSFFSSHGVYVDYQPATIVSFKKNIPTTIWVSGYSDFLHYFFSPKSINRIQLRNISNKEWLKIKKAKFLAKEERKLNLFFINRYFKLNSRDIPKINYFDSRNDLKKKFNFGNNNKIFCLFAHVNWDTAFDQSSMLFNNANSWVLETLEKMKVNRNVNWIVRIHPGESIDGSVFTTYDLIKKHYLLKKLPSHIKIISDKADINSYSFYKFIDGGITVFGTVGIELAVLGKPVITAGNSHYSNKGFTIDAKTKDEYFLNIKKASRLSLLNSQKIILAKKYAYNYFINQQISFDFIYKKQGHWGNLDIKYLPKLLPRRNKTIDKVCNRIIYGK
jgi:hypothetical protein